MAQDSERQAAPVGRSDQAHFMAWALQDLHPIDAAHATLPILQGFNWAECLAGVEEGQWYLVVFRSVRATMYDEARVTEFDEHAYQEALASSGLLHYYRGAMNEHRQCLSLCVWENQTQAHLAARLPRHQAAARLAHDEYDSFVLERHLLVKRRDSDTLTVEPAPLSPGHAKAADSASHHTTPPPATAA